VRRGIAASERSTFGPTRRLDHPKTRNAHRDANRSNKHREQTNIKQINRLARHQCHHPVALDAQISKHLSKTERPVNRAFPLNETHEQNGSTMTTIGYACVSTDGRSLQSQTEALHLASASKVYSEKQSGARTDRPQLAKAIAALAEGDCLVMCKLDRLARSTRDLLNTLATIGERGATFKYRCRQGQAQNQQGV